MKKDPSTSNPQTIGWTASVVLHGGILAFITIYAYFWGFTVEGDVRITSSSQSIPQDVQRLVEPDAKDKSFLDTDRAMAQRVATHEGVRSVLAQASDRAAQMSEADRMRTLESNTGKLNQIKAKDMEDVLGHIETSMGIKAPQTQPADPARADAPFDPESSQPTDITPAIGPKKEPGYLWTLTDANGRTSTFFTAASAMSAEEQRLADLFEKARHSPNFGRALKTALKLAAKRTAEKAPDTQPTKR
jgi:hypothetical protein